MLFARLLMLDDAELELILERPRTSGGRPMNDGPAAEGSEGDVGNGDAGRFNGAM